jgi:hypothetical protein
MVTLVCADAVDMHAASAAIARMVFFIYYGLLVSRCSGPDEAGRRVLRYSGGVSLGGT